jgi:hypothetical protein
VVPVPDVAELLGGADVVGIDMPIGLTAINSEIKYDKKNSIDTTAFSQRSVQLAPNWAALR